MLPRREANCGGITECKKTNEVWALNRQYAAIRDIKMCGCPAEFIHGLAIPREVITGVEDLNREEGIWQFAWDNGIERIEAQSLALVVNPKSQRTQNQLHVHILRLDQNARARFEQYDPVYVDNLERVWLVAAKAANSKGLNDYGVLVAKDLKGKFLVLVSPNSPEAAFTIWKCSQITAVMARYLAYFYSNRNGSDIADCRAKAIFVILLNQWIKGGFDGIVQFS